MRKMSVKSETFSNTPSPKKTILTDQQEGKPLFKKFILLYYSKMLVQTF